VRHTPARLAAYVAPHLVELGAEPTTSLKLIRTPYLYFDLLGMEVLQHAIEDTRSTALKHLPHSVQHAVVMTLAALVLLRIFQRRLERFGTSEAPLDNSATSR
jgi:hypothetical protein